MQLPPSLGPSNLWRLQNQKAEKNIGWNVALFCCFCQARLTEHVHVMWGVQTYCNHPFSLAKGFRFKWSGMDRKALGSGSGDFCHFLLTKPDAHCVLSALLVTTCIKKVICVVCSKITFLSWITGSVYWKFWCFLWKVR